MNAPLAVKFAPDLRELVEALKRCGVVVRWHAGSGPRLVSVSGGEIPRRLVSIAKTLRDGWHLYSDSGLPELPCAACGSHRYWSDYGDEYRCEGCEPPSDDQRQYADWRAVSPISRDRTLYLMTIASLKHQRRTIDLADLDPLPPVYYDPLDAVGSKSLAFYRHIFTCPNCRSKQLCGKGERLNKAYRAEHGKG